MWSYHEPTSPDPAIMNWLTLAYTEELLEDVAGQIPSHSGMFRLIARGLAFEMHVSQQASSILDDTETGTRQRLAWADRVKNIPDALLRVIFVEYFSISPLEIEQGFQHCVGEETEYLHGHGTSGTPSDICSDG